MPDIYAGRLTIRGKKTDVIQALRFMAKKAASKTDYSYLYEIFLKPNEGAGSSGLTDNFDRAGDTDQVGFFFCGAIIRPILTVLEHETVFSEITSENPDVEFYAEMHNEGGIQETQPYMESFYSPAGNIDLNQGYIWIYQDPDCEEYDPSEEPFLSEEAIENQYLELWGKPKSYFDDLLSGKEAGSRRQRHDFYYIDACKEMLREEIKVSGFDTDEIKERFEHIQKGQSLFLRPNETGEMILFSEEGHVGTLSKKGNFEQLQFDRGTGEALYFGDVLQILNHILQRMPDSIRCSVQEVTPLSKRRKNAKYALLRVELQISEEAQERMKQEQHPGADFFEELVRSMEALKKSQ